MLKKYRLTFIIFFYIIGSAYYGNKYQPLCYPFEAVSKNEISKITVAPSYGEREIKLSDEDVDKLLEIIEKYQPAVDTDGKANYWSRKKSFQSAVFYIYSNNEKYFFYYYGELYNDLYSCYIENEYKKNATNLEIEKLLDHYMPFRSEQYTLYVPEIFSFEVTNCRTNKTTIVENDVYIDESIGLKRLQAEPIIEWYIGGSGMTDYNKPTTPLKDDEVVYKIRCSTSINEYLIKIGESKIQINDFTYKYKKSNFYGTQFPDSLVELVQKDIYYWFN